MIKNEDAWLRALQERNNVTHSYNEKIALVGRNGCGKTTLGIVRQAKAIFYDLFVQLKDEIDKNWL